MMKKRPSPTASNGSNGIASGSPKKKQQTLNTFWKGYVECPHCGEEMPPTQLARHVDDRECKLLPRVGGDEIARVKEGSGTPDGKNAFSILMSAAQKKLKLHANCRYILRSIDGKLKVDLVFQSAEDHSHSESDPTEFAARWSTQVSLRQFSDVVSLFPNESSSLAGKLDKEISNSYLVEFCTDIPSANSATVGPQDSRWMTWLYPRSDSAGQDSEAKASSNTTKVSILKSMLQKAVRRRRSSAVGRLAVELYRLAPDELLRRIPIICLEDASLHPALPVVVWCMVASSKGYVLPPWLVIVCVMVTVELAASAHKDVFPDIGLLGMMHEGPHVEETTPAKASARSSSPQGFIPIRSLPSCTARTLIFAMMVRGSYGGMGGDILMIRGFVTLWTLRYFSAEVHARTTSLDTTSCHHHMPLIEECSSASAAAPSSSELEPPIAAKSVPIAVDHSNIASSPVHSSTDEILLPMTFYLHTSYLQCLWSHNSRNFSQSPMMANQWTWNQLCMVSYIVTVDGSKDLLAILPSVCRAMVLSLLDHPSTSYSWGIEHSSGSDQVDYTIGSDSTNVDHRYLLELSSCVASFAHSIKPADEPVRPDHDTVRSLYTFDSSLGLFTLRREHLLLEGLDFHCYPLMIPQVLSRCSTDLAVVITDGKCPILEYGTSVQDLVQRAIWTFSSSTNYHRFVWLDSEASPLTPVQQLAISEESDDNLTTKRRLGSVWRVICGTVRSIAAEQIKRIAI